MKILAPVLTIFALLTDPQGEAVYVVKAQVVAVSGPHGCAADAHAKVFTAAGALCVAESIEDAMLKVAAP